MKKFIVVMTLMLLLVGVTNAQPYTVDNFSFELPGDGKICGWDLDDGAYYVTGGAAAEVPGWESDGTTADSGVETGFNATVGDWSAFLMGGDPSVYQLTDTIIAAGEEYMLLVDCWQTWLGTPLQMDLYYDDGGVRTQVATQQYDITTEVQLCSLTFAADDVPAAIGNNLGIELANVGSAWMGLDNVRLIPEPATMLLLGLGGLSLIRRRK